MRCEHDGLKFGRGQEPCLNPDTRQYGAGPWGAIWLCPDHKYHADDICAEARAAEREHGAALAQLARDERAMLRGR